MMCIGLIIERRAALDDKVDVEEVIDEVATRMNQGPNVNIPHCIDALIIIEDSFSISAHIIHRICTEGKCYDSMADRDYVGAVSGLIDASHLSVDGSFSLGDQMDDVVHQEEIDDGIDSPFEVVQFFMIGRLK